MIDETQVSKLFLRSLDYTDLHGEWAASPDMSKIVMDNPRLWIMD